MVAISRVHYVSSLKQMFNDALYRGSLLLLINTGATAVIGLAFWTLAARRYPASSVGAFSAVTSGIGLLAAVASLGLPNVVTRYIASARNSRPLITAAIVAIATIGTVLCLLTVLLLGPHLPPAMDLQEHGKMVFMVSALVGVTAVGSTVDSGLVAKRSTYVLLLKNLAGSILKILALLFLASLRSAGLLLSYGLGLGLSTVLGSISLFYQTNGRALSRAAFRALRPYFSVTSGNYIATVMGILPVTVVPLEVLAARGSAETAWFSVAFLVARFLNFIPQTVSQVLFAEASRENVSLGSQLRKAVRGIYALLLPAMVVVILASPVIMRVFGAGYEKAAGDCLRVLALSALFTGGTYLVDSMLIARDRIVAYIFMNGINAALVLCCVGAFVSRGLTAAAWGWTLAQGISLILGLVVIASGKSGRHRATSADSRPRKGSHYSQLREGRSLG